MRGYEIAGVLICIAVVYVMYERSRELFCISVRNGRVLLVRGRIPPSVLDGFSDVVGRAKVHRGTIRGLATEHHARLAVSGMDEFVAQRLRNVFGICPIARIRSAPLPGSRNIGQVLGIAWLAWLLAPRN